MLKWKKEFELGVLEIDNQHKKLVEIGVRLYDLIKYQQDEDNFDEVVSLLGELKKYTIEHFEYEESLFIGKINNEEEHIQGNKDFIEIVDTYESEISNMDDVDSDFIFKVIKFILDWIVEHINLTDREYVEFI